jgi:hypothetical protein
MKLILEAIQMVFSRSWFVPTSAVTIQTQEAQPRFPRKDQISRSAMSWLPYIARRNSAIAQGLMNAGAVLFAKTNSSQALLMVESINNIVGVVRNPYNLGLSVGGSSGGEAA